MTNPVSPDSLLTSYEVGEILQVNPSSVNKWIKDGLIEAFRTPGGHRRIRASDLVVFLGKQNIPVPPALNHIAKKRVLFVDDDHHQLNAILRVTKPYMAQVDFRTATNGIEALVLVGSFKPDLVVLDNFMPNLDGVEVCQRLKHNDETKEIKVILMSGNITPELEEKAKAAGAYKCAQKPLEVEKLLAEVGVKKPT